MDSCERRRGKMKKNLRGIMMLVLMLMASMDLTSQAPAVLSEGTPEECIDSFLYVVDSSGVSCVIIEDYIICLLQAMGVDSHTYTPDELQQIEKHIEEILLLYRITCDLDLIAIINRLKRTTTVPRITTTLRPQRECLTNKSTSCTGKEDGDYPICYPGCVSGHYITCSNGYIYVRPCASDLYGTLSKNKLQRMVFDPPTGQCLRSSTSCPRDLDAEIFTRK